MGESSKRRWPLVAVALVVVLVAAAVFLGGGDAEEAVDRSDSSLSLELGAPTPPSQAELDRLTTIARERGIVGVIARLKGPGPGDGAGPDVRAAIVAATAELEAALAGHGVEVVRRYELFPLVALSVPAAAIPRLAASPLVATLEEDHLNPFPDEQRGRATGRPGLLDRLVRGGSDAPGGQPPADRPDEDGPGADEPEKRDEDAEGPLADRKRESRRDVYWDIERVNAPAAWDAGFDGTGRAVAILDTGVDTGHEYFAGKVLGEACFTRNNSCPNGSSTQTGTGSGGPCPGSNCWHGTHVAGTAAGKGGVAPGAGILAVQVFDPAGVYDSSVIAGLEWVYRQKIDHGMEVASVNMSIGRDRFSDTCTDRGNRKFGEVFVKLLRDGGIVSVVSSGNNGYTDSVSSPACVSGAISVGNTTSGDEVYRSSNSYPGLIVLAPGTDVPSSMPGDDYGQATGTSMSAPHVAGALAVLAQKSGDTIETVLALLRSGVVVKDRRNNVAATRIDVGKAITTLSAGERPKTPASDGSGQGEGESPAGEKPAG